MLNAYKSAKLKVENKDSPVDITLGESTYEIERDSLQKVIDAIEHAYEIGQDDETSPGCRGLMSLPQLRNTEQALSSLVPTALYTVSYFQMKLLEHVYTRLHAVIRKMLQRKLMYIL